MNFGNFGKIKISLEGAFSLKQVFIQEKTGKDNTILPSGKGIGHSQMVL